jgi:hypothetical protein
MIGGGSMGIFIAIIMIVFLFDFTKFRKQNEMMIKQNNQIISLLNEIKESRKNDY